MKLIVAIITPEKLAAVQAAVNELEAYVLSVSQVIGDGREPGHTDIYRGREVRVPRAKLRVEAAVDDALAQRAVETIARAGATAEPGHLGNRNVFVMQLDACVGIPGPEPAPAVNGRWAIADTLAAAQRQ